MSRGLIADFRAAETGEIEKLVRSILTGMLKHEEYLAKCAAIKAHEHALTNFGKVAKKYFDSEETDNLEGET